MTPDALLLTRYGGIGDLVMILPTLAALHKKYPATPITFRTYRDYEWFFKDHPLIDRVVLDDNRFQLGYTETAPCVAQSNELFESGSWVFHYNFHGVIERSSEHGVLAFAREAGVVDLGADWVPKLPAECFDREPEEPYRTVVQLRSNQDGRGLGPEDFPDGFFRRPGVYPISQPLEPRRFVSLIANARRFIGPDSSGLHLAAACGVPEIIGLYSERFPPAIRAYPGVESFVDREAFRRHLDR